MTEYNVAKLAKDLDTEPHLVRARLRTAGVEKTDGKYEWAKQKEYEAVLKQLKGGGKAKMEDEPKGKSKKDAGAAPENKSGKKSKKGKAE
jgi:hypothetical protein